MKVLSLFSGGGLGDYGLELAGMEIIGQVEIDDYCQKILKLRWPEVPKWRDIREVKGTEVIKKIGRVDIISGGFPCQPFSVAGKQRGKQDDRYLWPEMFRVISEVQPAFVIGENVPGIIKFALDQVLSDLESIGYTCQAVTIPACAVDAPHKRDRVWILGYAEHFRQPAAQVSGSTPSGSDNNTTRQKQTCKFERPGEQYENVADTFEHEKGSAHQQKENRNKHNFGHNWNSLGSDIRNSSWKWPVEPNVGRVAHGITNRVDRLKLLGNGQVVQVVQWIGERIMEFELKDLLKSREK